MKNKYSITVQWSREYKMFVATCIEFPQLLSMEEDKMEAVKQMDKMISGEILNSESKPEPIYLEDI